MKDGKKTKAQLIEEINRLRNQVSELDAMDSERKRTEEALRESEAKYSTLVEQATDSILILQEGIVVYVNPAHVKLTGYPAKEQLGMNGLDIIHPEYRQLTIKRQTARMRGKEVDPKTETKLLCKDGMVKDVEATTNNVHYRGKPATLISLRDITKRKHAEEALLEAYDKLEMRVEERTGELARANEKLLSEITEHKQAEEALKESEERFRRLSEAAEEGIAIHDKGTIIEANEALARMFGYDLDELIGISAEVLATPETWGIILHNIATGYDQPYEGKGVRKDGSTFWCQLTGKPYQYQGETLRVATFRDITELKQAEKELTKTSSYLENILASSPNSIILTDKDGKFNYANPTFLDWTGHSLESLIGKTISEISPPLTSAEATKVIAARIERRVITGEPITGIEVELFGKEGKVIPVTYSAIGIKDKDGNVIGEECFITDITERKRVEDALRDSEERYRILADRNPHGIQVIDPTGIITYVNPAYQEMLGYTKEELLGKHISDLLEPASKRPELREYLLLLAKEQPESTTYYQQNRRKDGEVIEQAVSWNYNRDSEGKVIGFISIITNITERKQAEEALRESEEHFRIAFKISPDSITISDFEGTIVDINDGFTQLTGYTGEEVIGKRTVDLNLWHRASEREKFVGRLQKDGQVRNLETTFRLKDGSLRTGLVSASLMSIADKPLVLSITRDITERKQAEEALRESEEKFRKVFENAHDQIVLMDNYGTILAMNSRVLNILGYTQDKLIGRNVLNLGIYLPEDIQALSKLFLKAVDSGEVFEETELEVIHKDGHPVFVEVRTSLIRKEGEIEGVIAMVQDITDRKRADEEATRAHALEELDRLRGALIASVSHELRTPLTSIKGLASTLIQPDVEWDQETQKEFLITIDQSADRLTRIVSDLLEMSQLEAGMMKMQPCWTSINDVIKDIFSELETTTKNHQLAIDISPDLPLLWVDDTRIGEVLSNLISNAAAYSDEGTTIILSAIQVNDEIIVRIADQGIGIPAEQSERVFDLFFRLESGTARRKGGTGLGLSICKGIVEAHSGRIWMQSEVGQGAEFSFSLPVMKNIASQGNKGNQRKKHHPKNRVPKGN